MAHLAVVELAVRAASRAIARYTVDHRVVEGIAHALTPGTYDVDREEPTVALIPVNVADFVAADWNIVTSWFRARSQAPCADPWNESLSNGRHRLWSVWQAAPDALVPIHSDLLAYLDDVPSRDESFARGVARSALDGLRRMPSGPARRSPRYVKELRRVAREVGTTSTPRLL